MGHAADGPGLGRNRLQAKHHVVHTLAENARLSDFTLRAVLGRGSFGKVLLAERVGTGATIALKVIRKEEIVQNDDYECARVERAVLAQAAACPFIVQLHATFQTESRLFFVMEFLNGGDLMYHITKAGPFPEPRARFYAAEIVLALEFLHGLGVVYRDLKLDNVLLDSKGHIKLADFGMCKEGMLGDARTRTFCGTPGVCH
jgi:serine/threonine protein kinase